MDKRYRIVFKGQLLPGFTLDEVCENLALQFKASEDAIRQKLSQLPAILKTGLDVHQANHYLEVLASDGLITQLEVITDSGGEIKEKRLHQRRYAQDRRRNMRTSGIVTDRRKGSDRRKPR